MEVVQEIFRLFKLGYGLQQIANKLTVDQRDIEQKWYKDKIKYIITNPFYAGYMTMNRYVKGMLQLKMETWTWSENKKIFQQLCHETNGNIVFIYMLRDEKSNGKKKQYIFWLRDILHCNECQQPLKTKIKNEK